MNTVKNIKVILFNDKEAGSPITERFISILKGRLFLKYNSENELNDHIEKLKREGYASKEVLILKHFNGRFFQLCPGSPEVICCNYRVINTCFNCLYDCTYCYLNSYLNSYGIVQFTNIDRIYTEIDEFLSKAPPGKIYRIGTGEFTDSLMMDEVSGTGRELIKRMSSIKNVMLELKTKSNNIDHLLGIKEKGNAVLAWSLNTERNILRYERDAAPLMERIKTAKKAGEGGFYLAFHFDPIIIYPGWQDDYKNIIDILFNEIKTESVVWISLGCFRYSPGFKDVMRDNFPEENLTTEEMFPGVDGKMRYLKKMRIDIYRKMKQYINCYTDKPFIYLCMENSGLWHSIFNINLTSSDELESLFSDYLKEKFLK